MGKKDNAKKAAAAAGNQQDPKINSIGEILFDASEQNLDDVAKHVNLAHVCKPWTREAWERARPWVLEQRQKLEGMGWLAAESARTELYVLKKNAPSGSFTDDGLVYIRIPKKFIDFHRSGRAKDDESAKKRHLSKRREGAPGYAITDPLVWRLRIDAESEDADREPSVMLDAVDAMENLVYLVMTLQPGIMRLTASRDNVVQPGTRTSLTREDAPVATVRHTAMVAEAEHYMRYLPPAFWFKRNEMLLRQILGDAQFEATQRAAADGNGIGAVRTVKGLEEKTWEEELKGPDGKPIQTAAANGAKTKKGKKTRSSREHNGQEGIENANDVAVAA